MSAPTRPSRPRGDAQRDRARGVGRRDQGAECDGLRADRDREGEQQAHREAEPVEREQPRDAAEARSVEEGPVRFDGGHVAPRLGGGRGHVVRDSRGTPLTTGGARHPPP